MCGGMHLQSHTTNITRSERIETNKIYFNESDLLVKE